MDGWGGVKGDGDGALDGEDGRYLIFMSSASAREAGRDNNLTVVISFSLLLHPDHFFHGCLILFFPPTSSMRRTEVGVFPLTLCPTLFSFDVSVAVALPVVVVLLVGLSFDLAFIAAVRSPVDR